MSRELYISDARYKLSSKDMIKNIETIDNKTIYYYNENYIEGKTIQYEIFDGIWIVYDDVVIKTSEQLFPVEETGLIEMNYCISGRCEFNFLNHKVFYMGTGDFVAALSNDEQHEHNFPLGNYKGISITTSPKNLDDFLKTIFPHTSITSNLLVNKMRQYGKYKYMILSDNSSIQKIMKEIILPDNIFWREKTILKFAELTLLLINHDIEAGKVKEKYFDRQLTDKVKMIKNEVTKNTEVYVKIKQISEKYDINSNLHIIKLDGKFTAHISLQVIDYFKLNTVSEKIQLSKIIENCDAIWVGYCGWYDIISNVNDKKIVYDKMDDDASITQNKLLCNTF